MEVRSKQAEGPANSVTPYVAAEDRSLLEKLISIGKLDEVVPGKTADSDTDAQLKRSLASIIEKGEATYYPSCIEHSLSTLKFPNHVGVATARVKTYCFMFLTKCEGGIRKLHRRQPKTKVCIADEAVLASSAKTRDTKKFEIRTWSERRSQEVH